jgi:hypothetical protein
MTTEQPFVAERIAYGAGTFTIELILERANDSCARVDSLGEGVIDISDMQMNRKGSPAEGARSANAV